MSNFVFVILHLLFLTRVPIIGSAWRLANSEGDFG